MGVSLPRTSFKHLKNFTLIIVVAVIVGGGGGGGVLDIMHVP